MIARRRLCVAVDLVGFSSRRAEVQADLQCALRRTLKGAWRDNGGAPAERRWQGDGEVALASPTVDESAFVSGFVRSLRIALRRANWGLPESSPLRMRVRVAMHTGAAAAGRPGLVGTGVVRTCRLLDAEQLRAALAAQPESDVALIVSQALFEDVVWAERHELTRADFQPVRIMIEPKSFTADAWIHVAISSLVAAPTPLPLGAMDLLAMAVLMARRPVCAAQVAQCGAAASSRAAVASLRPLVGVPSGRCRSQPDVEPQRDVAGDGGDAGADHQQDRRDPDDVAQLDRRDDPVGHDAAE